VWQALRTQLLPLGIEIVTIALDTGGAEAVRPWLDAAKPEHPSLIDVAHVTDDLLGFVNVPNSVWIDEHGMIVRPAEPAWPGSTPVIDMLPAMTDHLPPERRGVVDEVLKMKIDPAASLAMLLDWAEKGAESQYVLSPDEVIARSHPRGDDEARAAAHFELGQHLFAHGDHDAAVPHWREAHRLYPANWTYKRQAWNLEGADTVTPSDRYDGSWLVDVRAIGAENYYPAIVP
jgi:tetratricopeptide (TPR) repeat protein